MTLLSVVQAVSEVVGVESPASVFSNIVANRTAQELLALANEMAQRVAYDNREWRLFMVTATFNGDGVTSAFPLPNDFKRFLLTTNLWRSTSYLTPMRYVPDLDEWNQRRSRGIYDGFGEWSNFGGNINIAPIPLVGQTVRYTYLSKNCVGLAGGGVNDSFMNDNDTFLLDERLLKLAMIWQWKEQKGAPYQEALGTYSDAVAVAMGNDAPAPIIIGRMPLSKAARTAYPFPVPTP